MSKVFRTTALIVGLLLVGSSAHAVSVLQVYLEGATWDTTTETWVLQGSPTGAPARLWVIGNTGAGTIEDVHIAAAYDGAYSPQIVLRPATPASYGGFTDPSVAAAASNDGTIHTGIPIMESGEPLPVNGDDTYDAGQVWQRFDLGDFTLQDSPIAEFCWGFPEPTDMLGQINVYDLSVVGDLPENFVVHFDVYNHVYGRVQSSYACCQDAEVEVPAVPEPLSMIMFGCVGAGMVAARKLRRRKA